MWRSGFSAAQQVTFVDLGRMERRNFLSHSHHRRHRRCIVGDGRWCCRILARCSGPDQPSLVDKMVPAEGFALRKGVRKFEPNGMQSCRRARSAQAWRASEARCTLHLSVLYPENQQELLELFLTCSYRTMVISGRTCCFVMKAVGDSHRRIRLAHMLALSTAWEPEDEDVTVGVV